LWSHRLASIRGYQRQTILFFIDRSQDKTLKNISFKRFIEEKFAVKPDSHADFHRWSCENHAKFWESLLTFTGNRSKPTNLRLSSLVQRCHTQLYRKLSIVEKTRL
ncbi:hypothetical protein KIN20_007753, partial [Parelaphostrongylus tenuis]